MNTVELIIVIALFAMLISGVPITVSLVQDTYVKNEIAFDMFHASAFDQAHIEENIFAQFTGAANALVSNRTPCIEDVVFNYATGTYKVMTLNRLFFNVDRDNTLGGDCLGYPNEPEELTEKDSVIIPNVILTDIDIYEDVAIVSGYSDDSETSDLYLLSLGSLEILDHSDSGFGINAIDVAENIVYAAARQDTGQLQIFLRDEDDLVLIATSSLPTITGSWPEGLSVFYENEKVYIGTHRTAGREFQIYDVSNPYDPIWLGFKEINHNVNHITVRDGIAYLATSGNIRDVIVLDVHDPTNIIQIAALDIAGNEDGRRVFLSGNVLYLGRYKSITPSTKDVYALKLDPSDPTSFEIIFSKRLMGDVSDILGIHSTVLVGSKKQGGEVTFLNMESEKEIFVVSVSAISGFDIEDDYFISVSENGEVDSFKMK